jgi:hypothetical protein
MSSNLKGLFGYRLNKMPVTHDNWFFVYNPDTGGIQVDRLEEKVGVNNTHRLQEKLDFIIENGITHPCVVLGDGTTVGETLWVNWKKNNVRTGNRFLAKYYYLADLFERIHTKLGMGDGELYSFVYSLLKRDFNSFKNLRSHVIQYASSRRVSAASLEDSIRFFHDEFGSFPLESTG